MQGLPPRDANGKPYELHHIGQKQDSPLAELTIEQHRLNNYSILHDRSIQSEVHNSGFDWDAQRAEYWKARVNTI